MKEKALWEAGFRTAGPGRALSASDFKLQQGLKFEMQQPFRAGKGFRVAEGIPIWGSHGKPGRLRPPDRVVD